jgi:hypothetical protein
MSSAASTVRSGSEKRQRQAVRQMRLSVTECAQLDVAAERAGMSISAFMRHQCLGTSGPRAARRPPLETALLAQALGQLGKCGSNVNQIAHALNAGGDEPDWIAETLADVRAACADIMRALGKTPHDH